MNDVDLEPTVPLDYEALWRDAIAAVRLLGSEVRRRDAEVRRLRAELEER